MREATSLQHQRAAIERPIERATEQQKPEGKVSAPEAKPSGKDEGFSFWDLLDIVNPLQHIPVVNTIYREVTGDTIKAPAKLAGAAILGGPIGLALAAADVVLEDQTGADAGGHIMAFLKGSKEAPPDTPSDTMLAEAAPAAVPPSIPPAETFPSRPAAPPPHIPASPLVPGGAMLPKNIDGGKNAAALATLAAIPSGSLPGGQAPGGTPPAAEPFSLGQHQSDALEALAAAGRTSPGVPKDRPRGMGLDRYRALADAGGGTIQRRTHVPTPAEQAARKNSPSPIQRAAATVPPPTLVHPSLIQASTAQASAPVSQAAGSGQSVSREPGAWPPEGPQPVPRELVADMMKLAMEKYELQAKARQAVQATR